MVQPVSVAVPARLARPPPCWLAVLPLKRRVRHRDRILHVTAIYAGTDLGRVTADRAVCECDRSITVVDSAAVARAFVVAWLPFTRRSSG